MGFFKGRQISPALSLLRQAKIYCINFNHASTAVVVSSDHGTIHVFNLEEPKGKESSSMLTKYFTSQWSFCKFSIPQGPPCICAFGSENNSVIGEQFIYSVNSNEFKITFNFQ